MDLWAKEGWPVQFLMRDHFGAKVLYDNQVFYMIKFYDHKWKWDEKDGLSLLFKPNKDQKADFVPYRKIAQLTPIQETAQGWLLWDGWIYGPDGIIPQHLWQWEKLEPIYRFPENHRPEYCFLDLAVTNWEHDGLPGFGPEAPHGHTSMEFGDEDGNFYSVGLYMDPRSPINMKVTPAAILKSCLMAPDPYLPSKGEKTLHRYNLGSGKEGKENFKKVIQMIEEFQGYRKDRNGHVTTCRSWKYHAFRNNCADYLLDMEKYVSEELGAKLVKLDDTSILAPTRKRVERKRESDFQAAWHNVKHRFILFMVDTLLFILMTLPWIKTKVGVGQEDDWSDFKPYEGEPNPTEKMRRRTKPVKKPFSLYSFFALIFGVFRPHAVTFPRRMRLDHYHDSKLRDYTCHMKS